MIPEALPPSEMTTNWVGISALVLSAMGFMSAWLWKAQSSVTNRFEEYGRKLEMGNERFRKMDEELSVFKLEVAKSYASRQDLRELEERITEGFKDIRQAIDALTKAFNDHRAEDRR